ncbi:putative metalloreductase transmembrane component [Aspergillus tetrazonus]
MDIPAKYAVAAGGILLATVLIRMLPPFISWIQAQMTKCLNYPYPYFIRRRRLVGPWTWTSFFCHMLYLSGNLVALAFQTSSLGQLGLRAGKISLVNMTVLFAGSLLGFLGMSLHACRRIHRAAAWMSGLMLACHVVIAVVVWRKDFSPSEFHNLCAITGAGIVAIVLFSSLPRLRSLAFEMFLLGHQLLAGLLLYALWQHLPSSLRGSRLYLIIMLIMALLTFTAHGAWVVYQNGILQKALAPFTVRVKLPKPIKLRAGQYVYLWMPFMGFWSWTQSHPYMVISWSQEKQRTLELYVHPRQGFSARLLERADMARGTTVSLTGFISAPHGVSESLDRYERVVAISSGSGVAAVIPYLQMLIFGCNTFLLHTRRIHFIWETRSIGKGVLSISLFVQSDAVQTSTQFGRHKRAMVHYCSPKYEDIISRDLFSDIDHNGNIKEPETYDKQPDAGDIEAPPVRTRAQKGESLVMVSATGAIRDNIRAFVRQNVKENVKISELEYQPPVEW